MKPNKKLAALAAGGLVVAAFGVSFAAPAQAATITVMNAFNAEPVNQAGVAAYNPAASTASLVATQAATSQDVNLAIQIATGPVAGFAAVGAGSYQYEFDIQMDGTTVLSGDQCETNPALSPAVDIGASYAGIGGSSPIPTLNCTIPSVALGSHTFDIINMNVNGNGSSSGNGFVGRVGFDANVNPSADPAPSTTAPGYVPTSNTALWGFNETLNVTTLSLSIDSITGQNGGSTSAARTGNTINVTASGFSSGGSLQLCNPAGTTCTDSGTFNAAGVGSLTVTAAAATGSGTLKATAGTQTKSAPITILAARSFTLNPPGGSLPASVTIQYQNLDPNESFSISSAATFPVAGGPIAGSIATGTASATGTGSVSYTVPLLAKSVSMSNGFPVTWSVSVGWVSILDTCIAQTGNTTGAPGCATGQIVKIGVLAGNLTQTASALGTNPDSKTVDLGTIQTASTAGTKTGNINSIAIADNRGGQYGWSLNATMTNFSGGGSLVIDKSNLTINPGCSVTTGAAGITAGPAAQNFGATVALCSKDATTLNPAGSTGGTYSVSGPISLNVPAFQAVGSYSATMTITLV